MYEAGPTKGQLHDMHFTDYGLDLLAGHLIVSRAVRLAGLRAPASAQLVLDDPNDCLSTDLACRASPRCASTQQSVRLRADNPKRRR